MLDAERNRILRVNLSKGTITEESQDETFWRRYWGGRCVGLYYVLKELKPGIDPLGPENKLVFSASVITGVPAPGISRYNVAAKSPLTGGYGEAQAGGYWGPELRFAGYSVVIVEGRAEQPVYLWINDGKTEIRDAAHLWGKTTGEVEDMIREDLGDRTIRVAQIGPAGEKLVRFACILNECSHVNGRTGMGAVMGSKNLRAIAVRGKDRKLNYDDRDGMSAVVKRVLEARKTNPDLVGLNRWGTSMWVDAMLEAGQLPTRNFQTGVLEGAEKLSARQTPSSRPNEGCYACAIKCKQVVELKEPYEVDPRYGGPEYETLAALGSNCGISDPKAVYKANELCGGYGLDTISTGSAIAFAMECFENGVIERESTDGIDLRFGNADAMLTMVRKIGLREGIGDLLAEGTKRAAERLGRGSERYAIEAKGQECPMHDPRGKVGLALAYGLSPFGGDHLQHEHDVCFDEGAPEINMEQAKILGISERLGRMDFSLKKVRLFHYLQNDYSFLDSICGCLFAFAPARSFKFSWLTEFLSAVTGWEVGLWELMKLGERGNAMARAFNVREGMSNKNDEIPGRFFEPIQTGPLKGNRLKMEDYRRAIRSYYKMVGWDPESGVPTEEKLYELDVGWVAEELEKYGRLPR